MECVFFSLDALKLLFLSLFLSNYTRISLRVVLLMYLCFEFVEVFRYLGFYFKCFSLILQYFFLVSSPAFLIPLVALIQCISHHLICPIGHWYSCLLDSSFSLCFTVESFNFTFSWSLSFSSAIWNLLLIPSYFYCYFKNFNWNMYNIM